MTDLFEHAIPKDQHINEYRKKYGLSPYPVKRRKVMDAALLFWILYILWIALGFFVEYVPGQPYPVRRVGLTVLFAVMIGLLGYKVFGIK